MEETKLDNKDRRGFDMEYGSATLEDIAEYDMVISQIFGTEEQASDTVPFTELAAEPFEKSDALIYTPVMFNKVDYACTPEEVQQHFPFVVLQETQACSLIAYHRVIKEFTDDQRKIIADVELDGLLRILPVTIRRNMCRSIAELYDPTCDAFIIDGEPLTMTTRDVEQIFGIPARGFIWLEPGGKDVSRIYRELEAHEEHRITFAQLQKTLKAHIKTNEHGIYFLRPFILYSIGVLLCPTTQRYVSSTYLPKVATMESIKAKDFAKLSRDHLMKCIIKYNAARKDPEITALQGTVNLEGNLPLLQFWFWEKRRLDRLDRTIDYNKRDTPLVQYWDEPKARKVCAIFDKHGLEAGETVHDLKEPWDVPRSPTPEMFDKLPPTNSKPVLAFHDAVLRMRKDLMEQHLQTRVQMLRKFRQLEKENSDMRNLLYSNLNANDYWGRPEYDYKADDKSVPSPLRGRDLASDFDDDTTMEHKEFERDLEGGQDDTNSEHKEFDKDDVLKSDVALPVNVKDAHWYVSVVNAKKRAVQVLDSKLSRTNQFKKAHPELENMDDIPRFRKQLSALLVESTFNSRGRRNGEE
ncbi:hypothetical protein D1007_58497 [Hordeum vulgare]|nr:hypothetical protein D1007_58497 [Hordeum vulgare]